MKKYRAPILFLSLLFPFLFPFSLLQAAPNFSINPYIQNPSTDGMSVYVETTDNTVQLHYRKLDLGSYQPIAMNHVNGSSTLYSARLPNLTSNTRYQYYVSTNNGHSSTAIFKTWPSTSDGVGKLKIVAFSDSQGQHPNRLGDIVTNGIIKNDCANDINRCDEFIAAVIVPGDLVQTGSDINQWRNNFLAKPTHSLAVVAVIPAIGNHDYSLSNFINYFELPDNGYASYQEQWYSFDLLNLRLITLNSNSEINASLNTSQRQWLDQLLLDTENNTNIDYIFFQIHHPCKSEMWTPGESDLTCEYVAKFEQLSKKTGKISGHLFGHTHAYSRGQSRDVNHLWLNAAVSSGDIDYWDEYPQFDYDIFQKSYPEYGYSTLEFGVNNKSLKVKRYSGGDGQSRIFNYQGEGIRDDFEIGGHNHPPLIPETLSPKQQHISGSILLQASAFSDPDSDSHLESHWQMATDIDFNDLVEDIWGNKTRKENIWKYQNTQQGVALNQYLITNTHSAGDYYWRIRYRDNHWAWSEWSAPAVFSLDGAVFSNNLVLNPGAEAGLENWTIETGVVEANASNDCGGISAYEGDKYFSVGGICNHSALGELSQSISLDAFTDAINEGAQIELAAYMRDWDGNDIPQAWVTFYDQNGVQLSQSDKLSHQSASWSLKTLVTAIPANARSLKVWLRGTRHSGTDNDSYVDNVSLRLITYPDQSGNQTENLIHNPGAENDLASWQIESGVVESQTAGTCSGISPQAGSRYFVLGGLCNHSSYAKASQLIDISTISGNRQVSFSAYMRNWSGKDVPAIWLEYLDQNGQTLSSSQKLSHTTEAWTQKSMLEPVPVEAASIKVLMEGTRNSGADNDSYLDDLSLIISY